MNLKHAEDVNAIANAMLLDCKDREYLGELATGSAIIKLQGRWFRPFLVKFSLIPIKKGLMTDGQLRQRMDKLLTKNFNHPFESVLLKEMLCRQILSIAEDAQDLIPENTDEIEAIKLNKQFKTCPSPSLMLLGVFKAQRKKQKPKKPQPKKVRRGWGYSQ
jgi:hypothetical protein